MWLQRVHDELDMLVPASMTERYAVQMPDALTNRSTRSTISVDCIATYSNFRRFEVQVEMSVGATRH